MTRKTTAERRPASSPRPEQPTIKPTSYTTSWDLTDTGSEAAQEAGTCGVLSTTETTRRSRTRCGREHGRGRRHMLPSKALEYARDLVASGWCQGVEARDEDGNPVEPWDPG